MAFYGTTFNDAYFRREELQIAAALYLYCQNADGSYADTELIGAIILHMRKTFRPALPCQGIETFLRDSCNPEIREAWREVQDNEVEWRGKAEAAYWTWRHRMTDLVHRLVEKRRFVKFADVEGYDLCLRENSVPFIGQDC